MNDAARATYQARLRRVLVHIDAHVDADLSLEALSNVAAFSKHHFHRQFSAVFGVTVGDYVQLVRLRRASQRLAFRPQTRVLEIALDAGYEGPEAFARAFRRRIGQTPSAFRKQPDWKAWLDAETPLRDARIKQMTHQFTPDDVRIIAVPATPVAALEHRGDPALIGQSIRAFIAWRKAVGLPPARSATFNILYDDPETTAPADYRLDLCAATSAPIAPNPAGVTAKTIPAGRCAVLRLTGSDDGLNAAALYLYRDWLPASGEALRDFPLYRQLVRFFPDVPEHEAVSDLFLPLV